MDFKDLKSAADIFVLIKDMQQYVSWERFALAAKAVFHIEDEKLIHTMYGYLQKVADVPYYIANDVNGVNELLPRALEIAQAANAVRLPDSYLSLPRLGGGVYKPDYRRYYYTLPDTKKEVQSVDISMGDPDQILLFAELLKQPGLKFRAVTHLLGELEYSSFGEKKKQRYYEGDIVFVFADSTDRVFYSWYNSKNGVYLATDEGWKKLIYTSGRGYLDKQGEPDLESDKAYSDYAICHSGVCFKIIGNIHDDYSVLVEKKDVKKSKTDK